MKILILSGIFPPDIGGPATQLDALAQVLVKMGYKLQILTFGQSDKIKYLYPVKKVNNKLFFIFFAFKYSRKADIIYAWDLYTAGFTGFILKKIFDKSFAVRFVGDSAWENAASKGLKDDIITFQQKKYNFMIELRKKLRKNILISADKIVVASNFLKDLALKIGVKESKIKVIYNSVDFLPDIKTAKDKQSVKKDLGFKGIMILTIARLVPWKGIDMLIDLMPDLIEKYKQINLVILGQGQQMSKLKSQIDALKLNNNIFLKGKVDRQTTLAYLQAADLFVLNTNYEGHSHCLLEAMKMGVPIITTFAGGNTETIKNGQTGLLINFNYKDQWQEAICKILDQPQLADKIALNAKKDLIRFSWSKLVKETTEVFNSL